VVDTLRFAQQTIENERLFVPVPQAEQLITVYIRCKLLEALRLSVDVWPESRLSQFCSEY